MTRSKADQFEEMLLRSLRLFWPAEAVRLLIVLDDESEADHEWGPELTRDLSSYGFASIRIAYEPPSDVYAYHGRDGHNRQQRSMFWADNFTSADYVGFLDTDTLFTTRVHPGDLFECGRPVVHGLMGKPQADFWAAAGNATAAAFGRPQVMRGMQYFPVIMQPKHLKLMRDHITENLVTENFDEAFRHIVSGRLTGSPYFSQFNMMATFIYYFHQCDYTFSLEELVPGYRETDEGHTTCLDDILDERNTFPRVKVAVHYRYITAPEPVETYLLEGYCRSEANLPSGDATFAARCSPFSPSTMQKALFDFEYHSWEWNSLCRRAQLKHYKALELSAREWPTGLVGEITSWAPLKVLR